MSLVEGNIKIVDRLKKRGCIIAKSLGTSVLELSCQKFIKPIFCFQYFNNQYHYWATEPNMNCKDGDIVLIKPMAEPQSDRVKHYVKEVVFKVGNVVDPITGRRCRGPEFADTQKYVPLLEDKEQIS